MYASIILVLCFTCVRYMLAIAVCLLTSTGINSIIVFSCCVIALAVLFILTAV